MKYGFVIDNESARMVAWMICAKGYRVMVRGNRVTYRVRGVKS